MQAKDVEETPILRYVASPRFRETSGLQLWATRWDIAMAVVPNVNEKVLLAKLRAMVKKGLLNGCACGCRGDFTITEKGRQALGATGGVEEEN